MKMQFACPCCGQNTTTSVPLFDSGSYEMRWGDRSVSVGPNEAMFIRSLIRSYPLALGKSAIVQALYVGSKEPSNPENNVRVRMCRFRKKLQTIGWTVKTVSGHGYRLARLEDVNG